METETEMEECVGGECVGDVVWRGWVKVWVDVVSTEGG